MNKTLVLVGNTAWSMYNFRKGVIRCFIESGFTVHIIAPSDEYEEKLINLGCHFHHQAIDGKGINPLKDLALIWKLRTIINHIKPDFCFFYTIKPNIYGSLVASILNIPCIAITTGLGTVFANKGLLFKIVKYMYSFSLRNTEQVWFLNNDDAKCFINNQIIDKEKAFILNGEGVDIERFRVVPIVRKSYSFLLVSRMLWDKGVGVYVDAARILIKEYPSVSFNLLGFLGVNNPSAISEEQMSEWVKEGVINYLGYTNNVIPFIENSTCIVLPSFYGEGVPFVLLEGAAMGRPIITTDNVGCRDVVLDRISGFLCEKKSVSSLVQAMRNIIEMDFVELDKMGSQGRKLIVDTFSEELVVKSYKSVLNKYLNS